MKPGMTIIVFFLGTILLASCAGSTPGFRVGQDDDQGNSSVIANGLNGHCHDPDVAGPLRDLGPLYTVGASVSHGLFAASFPKLIAGQMCLEEEAYDADFAFLFFKKNSGSVLKSILELRPKIIIAMDYPYHHVKLKYASFAKPILKKYITMLLLECESDLIDCSEGGRHQNLLSDPYRPTVFAGTVYFDCKFATSRERDDEDDDVHFTTYEACREENIKLNIYYRELEKEYPNLHLLPAFEIFSALHDNPSGQFLYSVDDVQRIFTKDELFFDGFHPWTDPGAYVLANVVIDGINNVNAAKRQQGLPSIPYIPIR